MSFSNRFFRGVVNLFRFFLDNVGGRFGFLGWGVVVFFVFGF